MQFLERIRNLAPGLFRTATYSVHKVYVYRIHISFLRLLSNLRDHSSPICSYPPPPPFPTLHTPTSLHPIVHCSDSILTDAARQYVDVLSLEWALSEQRLTGLVHCVYFP